jgi:uncharacterized protein
MNFHVMTKPVGPICNLDCKYCFYLEKEQLYPGKSNWRMSESVLETYIRQYIAAHDSPQVEFAWQGGEPTLMGVDFFRRVVELQQQHAQGKKVTNAIQTNGTLLDDEWCALLKGNQFLVGLSIDGPRKYHDLYRVDKDGSPTFDRVMAGMRLLKKHGVDFNTLCVVNRANSVAPLEVYQFLKTEGSGYIQFIPLVERAGGAGAMLAEPPVLADSSPSPGGGLSSLRQTTPRVRKPPPQPSPGVPGEGEIRSVPLAVVSDSSVTPWSVEPAAYGNFLCTIFDHWVRHDVGKVFVQLFDVHLGIWMGYPSSLCVFSDTCGKALAMEHNGDVYSCDHYVYPQYKLGNIESDPLASLVSSQQQRKFGTDKRDTLPKYCRECDVRFACNGECPKHRFMTTPDGEPGLNYLCPAYKQFFHHIDPAMRAMGQLVKASRPAAEIMKLIAEKEQKVSNQSVGRNDLCPCGSGKKYKKCCGR